MEEWKKSLKNILEKAEKNYKKENKYKNKHFIYCIAFDDGSCYIGESSNVLERIASHEKLLNKKSFSAKWYREKCENYRMFFILESFKFQSIDHCKLLEMHWMNMMEKLGFDLVNKMTHVNRVLEGTNDKNWFKIMLKKMN